MTEPRNAQLYREADALQDLYEPPGSSDWGEDPDWTIDDWKRAVDDDETRLGYWAWAVTQRDLTEGDEDE